MKTRVLHFQDLRVWQAARLFISEIYVATRRFPDHELYGMTSQIRRAAVSIATNIAEGSKRATTKDLCHFLNMAETSLEEVKNLLIIGSDLNYVVDRELSSLLTKADVIGAMLNTLKKSLQIRLITLPRTTPSKKMP